jgi:hypothetical protein
LTLSCGISAVPHDAHRAYSMLQRERKLFFALFPSAYEASRCKMLRLTGRPIILQLGFHHSTPGLPRRLAVLSRVSYERAKQLRCHIRQPRKHLLQIPLSAIASRSPPRYQPLISLLHKTLLVRSGVSSRSLLHHAAKMILTKMTKPYQN